MVRGNQLDKDPFTSWLAHSVPAHPPPANTVTPPCPLRVPALPWSTRGGRCRSGPAPPRVPPVRKGQAEKGTLVARDSSNMSSWPRPASFSQFPRLQHPSAPRPLKQLLSLPSPTWLADSGPTAAPEVAPSRPPARTR